MTLVELTGRPLSQEEEQAISQELEDGEIDYTKLLSFIKSESEDVTRGRDLYQDQQYNSSTFWNAYGLYIITIGVAIVLLVSLLSCVICCPLCMRPKRNVESNRQDRYQAARDKAGISL